jgi:type VI secretion system protein ImpB
LLNVGDFSNGKAEGALSEHDKIDINKNNFNAVLSEQKPEISVIVKNALADGGSE